MARKKLAGQELILLTEYLERLLNWKLWIDEAEELLAAADALERRVRSFWEVIEANFNERDIVREEGLHISRRKICRGPALCSSLTL